MYATFRKDVDPAMLARRIGRRSRKDVRTSCGIGQGRGGEGIDYIGRGGRYRDMWGLVRVWSVAKRL